MKKRVKVCVIGAGILGLKTAHDLAVNSHDLLKLREILVLEALNRVGGRIFTNRHALVSGHSYDMGASWFHDSLTNRVLQDAIAWEEPFCCLPLRDTVYNDGEPLVYVSERKGPVDMCGLKIEQAVADLNKSIELRYFNTLDEPDQLLQHLAQQFQTRYRAFVLSETADLAARMARTAELWFGIPWHKISGKYASIDHQGRNLFNVKGYDHVIDYLVSKLDSAILQMNTPVRGIDHSRENTVIVTTDKEEIECDFVVVTVPVSILQLEQGHPNGIAWYPPFPKSLSDALTTVHFGALGKVVFEFDSVWWDMHRDLFVVLGNGDSDSVPLCDPPAPFSYPLVAFNGTVIEPNCKALIVLTQSPLTEYCELNPAQAWAYFKPMLMKLVVEGCAMLEPLKTIVSDWTLNPWIRGLYTALTTGDDALELIIQLLGEHNDIAATSGVGNKRVRFAGEHTILDGAGCVHGAYCSGEREAQWILTQIGEQSIKG